MKKIFVVVSMFLSFLLLSSCKATEPVSVKDTHISNTGMLLQSLVANISQDISTDNAFLTCSSSAIDMCIQEYWYDAGKEISCDEYLLEENKTSCERNKVISSAKTTGNETLCETLGAGKEACVYEVVSMKAMTTKDETLCTWLWDSFSIQCHNKVVTAKALEQLDAKLCETLKTQENDTLVREMCQDEVAYNIGLQERK